MRPDVSVANRELVPRIPADGIDPSRLCRPLDDLGIRANAGFVSVRIESSRQWKWDSEDAAFLARIERLFPISVPSCTLRGLPADLQKLIERFFTGRARVRACDLLDVLAEFGSRALVIVAVLNALMGTILAYPARGITNQQRNVQNFATMSQAAPSHATN